MKIYMLALVALLFGCAVQAQEVSKPKIPFTPAVKAGNLLFISGQVGIDAKTGKLIDTTFEAELRQVMDNLKKQLDAHKIGFDDLVSTIIYLKDMDRYEEVNKIYGEYFKNKYPSRTCIAVFDLPAKASVEISAIGLLPE